MTDDHSKMLKNGVEIPMSATPMILNTVAMIVYALLINWLINKSNANNLVSGATIGFIIGLISCIQVFIGNLFAANSNTLSMVDGSYALVVFTVIGAILGAWQKK
jgi:uncharacterized membrane protein